VVIDVVGSVASSFTVHKLMILHLFIACKLTGIQEISAIPHPDKSGSTLALFLWTILTLVLLV
jgi:hypothetical protein